MLHMLNHRKRWKNISRPPYLPSSSLQWLNSLQLVFFVHVASAECLLLSIRQQRLVCFQGCRNVMVFLILLFCSHSNPYAIRQVHARNRLWQSSSPTVQNTPLDTVQSKNYCKSRKGDVIGSSTVLYSLAVASWITNRNIQHTHTHKR